MAIKWDSSLETGYDRVDDQHRNLFKKLTEFQDCCKKGSTARSLMELFIFIDRYVLSHFVLEEAYMFGHHYPDMEFHRKAHNELKKEYQKINAIFTDSDLNSIMALKANRFLGVWWLEHINKQDKRMVSYIKKTLAQMYVQPNQAIQRTRGWLLSGSWGYSYTASVARVR